MKSFSLLTKSVLAFALCIAAQRFCYKKTDGFSIRAISSNRPFEKTYETRPLSPHEEKELAPALDQPYSYFGCGGQAFAFFSADGDYVIKFFKQRLFRPPHLLNALPLPSILHRYREKRNFARSDKLARDFFSYRVAFDELKQETGLLYTHLNSTNHLKKKLKITDKLGIVHILDLDRFDFIVQRRALRVYDYIERCKSREMASEAFVSVFDLIKRRACKGYRDRDPNVRTNCGFIGKDAVKIDVGRFVPSMQMQEEWQEELKRIVAPFEDWIQETHPKLLPLYREKLMEALAT